MSYFGIGSDYETAAYEQHESGYFEEGNYCGGPSYKTCKHCGEYGFLWTKHQGQWRMTKGGKIHSCLTERAAAKALEFKKKAAAIVAPSIDEINDMLTEAALEDRRKRFS